MDLGSGAGFVLPDDVEPVAPVALLPALDPTPMGWQHRDWYLSAEYQAHLFDGTGNVGC